MPLSPDQRMRFKILSADMERRRKGSTNEDLALHHLRETVENMEIQETAYLPETRAAARNMAMAHNRRIGELVGTTPQESMHPTIIDPTYRRQS